MAEELKRKKSEYLGDQNQVQKDQEDEILEPIDFAP